MRLAVHWAARWRWSPSSGSDNESTRALTYHGRTKTLRSLIFWLTLSPAGQAYGKVKFRSLRGTTEIRKIYGILPSSRFRSVTPQRLPPGTPEETKWGSHLTRRSTRPPLTGRHNAHLVPLSKCSHSTTWLEPRTLRPQLAKMAQSRRRQRNARKSVISRWSRHNKQDPSTSTEQSRKTVKLYSLSRKRTLSVCEQMALRSSTAPAKPVARSCSRLETSTKKVHRWPLRPLSQEWTKR